MNLEQKRAVAKAFDDTDDNDWNYLFKMIEKSGLGQTGHGAFWTTKLHEIYQIQSDHSDLPET